LNPLREALETGVRGDPGDRILAAISTAEKLYSEPAAVTRMTLSAMAKSDCMPILKTAASGFTAAAGPGCWRSIVTDAQWCRRRKSYVSATGPRHRAKDCR
jgi:hypothetical protein